MQKLPADEIKRRLDSGEPLIVIDARSDDSWSTSDLQIPNSIRVPPDRTDEFVAAFPQDAPIITYCT
jgi:rhodanese-related sulfurtransferase